MCGLVIRLVFAVCVAANVGAVARLVASSVTDSNTTVTAIADTTLTGLSATTSPYKPSANSTVCYDTVGCFSNFPPFDNADQALPKSPEEIGTTFLLYTPTDLDPDIPHIIDHVNETLLTDSRYDPTLPTKFIIHGFTNNIKTKWLYELKDELLKKERCNVVIVVWGPGAALPHYSQAVANTRVVAKQTKMILDMMERQGGQMKQIHMIGHSLGAHTSGHIGYLLKSENRTLGRITGLDPAEPEYLDHPKLVRLDKNDADFVDVIHTNGAPIMSGGAGMWLACGDVDFYVNGGESQPGCHNQISAALSHIGDLFSGKMDDFGIAVSCSHMRAHEVFMESINSQCSFTAYPCQSYEKFQRGKCLSCGQEGCGVLGYYSDWYQARGQVYLNTRLSSPYCGHHYYLEMRILEDTRGLVEVQLNGTWDVSEWLLVTSTDKQENLKAGSVISKLRVSKQEVGNVLTVNIRYTRAPWHILHFSRGKPSLHAQYISILAGENGKRYKLCLPDPVADQKPTRISLKNTHC